MPAITGPPAARAVGARNRLASWPSGPVPKPTPASSVSKPRVSASSPRRAMTEPIASFSDVAPVISPAKRLPRPCATFVCSVAASSAALFSTASIASAAPPAAFVAVPSASSTPPSIPPAPPVPPVPAGGVLPGSSPEPATASRSACSDFSGAVAASAAAPPKPPARRPGRWPRRRRPRSRRTPSRPGSPPR